MPKAIDVAKELRNLADHIAKGGPTKIESPNIYFSYSYKYGDNVKDEFLALAKLLPRPLKKSYDEHDLKLEYSTPALIVWTRINRDKVCKIVKPAQPAEYECEPLLSEDEIVAASEEK